MAQVLFYQLAATPLEALVGTLVGRALGQGWRIEARGASRDRMEALDRALWLEPADGFLPHGLEGGATDARQPLLLTHGPGPAANAPDALLAIDGAEVTPAEAAMLQRVWIVFDGADPAALDRARDQWRLLAATLPAQYWLNEAGRWVKKAEHAPG